MATAIGVELTDTTISAEGDLDFRGTPGVEKEVAVGLQNIRLHFDLQSDAKSEQLEILIKLTERYCVAFQTLKKSAELSVSY